MRATASTRRSIAILWLLIVPPGFYLMYQLAPPPEVKPLYWALFACFGFFTTYFPIYFKGKPLFLVMWVTVPVFLKYGLFAEMVIMQLAILGGLFGFSNTQQSKPYRFFVNSLLFFVLSLCAAGMFSWVGGEIGSTNYWPVVGTVFVYQITHSIGNDFFLRLYRRFKHITTPYTESRLITYGTIIVALPLTLSLYFLESLVGVGAFLLLGIPFFFITFITRLYNRSEHINGLLKKASEIGQQLTELPTEQEIVKQFILQAQSLVDASHIYLFDHHEGWLELIRAYEREEFQAIASDQLQPGKGVAEYVMRERKPLIFSSRKEWLPYSSYGNPAEIESFLCVPIIRNEQVVAIILLGSEKKHAFYAYQLMILDLLGSHFTISIEKTRYLEEMIKRSEHCSLTKLYNYRYLEEKLEEEMKKLRSGRISSLSVLLLDIDHFKMINDQFGHESGNMALRQLGQLLQQLLPPRATVGRYGGEEFVYILPEMTKDQANHFAEQVRQTISSYHFDVEPDLQNASGSKQLQLTVSIGLATAPEDGDEGMAMLRNADRALFIGAKQAGRNRVAQYVK